MPLLSSTMLSRKHLLSITSSSLQNLADLQMHLLRRYVDLTALQLSSAVRMTVNGYLVDSAESVSILRDDDEIGIHNAQSDRNKRKVKVVQVVTPLEKPASHTGTTVNRETSNKVTPAKRTLQSSESSSESSNDSDDERAARTKKKDKGTDAKHEKSPATAPSVSSSNNTPVIDAKTMWNYLKGKEEKGTHDHPSKKQVSSNVTETPSRSDMIKQGKYGPASSERAKYGPSSSERGKYGPSSSERAKYGPASSERGKYGPSSGERGIYGPSSRDKMYKLAKYDVSIITSASSSMPQPIFDTNALKYEIYPLVGIESLEAGNRIAIQRYELCEKSRQPILSEYVECTVVSKQWDMLTVIFSELDQELLETIDIRTIARARIIKHQYTQASGTSMMNSSTDKEGGNETAFVDDDLSAVLVTKKQMLLKNALMNSL